MADPFDYLLIGIIALDINRAALIGRFQSN